jgi:replicative DNA helicase
MSELTRRQGPEFQRCVLKNMLNDSVFCSKAVHLLSADFFSGELAWFFKRISVLYEENKRMPLPGELRDQCRRQEADKEKYEKEFDSIMASEEIGRDYMKKELTAFMRANIFVSSVRQAADHYNSGDKQACYDFLKDKMNALYSADFETDRLVNFEHLDGVMEEARIQSLNAVPTGIKPVDDVMYGGMMPQTWTTFLAGSNVGKSMLCPNLAKAAYELKRKRTLVIVHEDEEIPTQLRYLACFSGIPYNRLLLPRSDLTEDEQRRIHEAQQILREYVRIRFMYSKESFIESVCSEARNIHEQWEYHLFLDDYLQCLKSKAFKSMEDTYTLHEFNTQELKQLCCELRVAGGGGAQVNRMGHKMNRSGADLLRCTDVGDSWGIVKKSSNVLTMNRSEQDILNNRITFLLDKARNAEKCPLAVQCETRYDLCQTHVRYEERLGNQIVVPFSQGKSSSA